MEKIENVEFIQSIIRLTIGVLTYIYISFGINSGYFTDHQQTLQLFAEIFFGYSFLLLISIYWKPTSIPRRYTALFLDILSTTVAAHLTGGINNAYILIYLWIYIGYGTRYGKRFLIAAMAFTFIDYNILLISQNAWSTLTLDALAFLLLIIALPIYLYTLQKRLQDAVISAEQANRGKTEFLSSMTHQIRTPIGGVVGMIDLLNKTELDTQQKQYLQALSQSSHTLQEIVEDIVDFSRIEQGQIKFKQQLFQPHILINSLVHSLAPIAYENDLELSCFISQNFPHHTYSDAPRLRQLLSNLIRYAIENCATDGVHLAAQAGEINSQGNIPIHISIQFTQSPDDDKIYLNDDSNDDNLSLRVGSQLTRLMGGQFDIQYKQSLQPCFEIYFNWSSESDQEEHKQPCFINKHVLIFDKNKRNQEILQAYCKQLGMDSHTTDGTDNLIAHILWAEKKNKKFDLIILCESLKQSAAELLIHRIQLETDSQAPIIYASYIQNIENTIAENFNSVSATMTKPVTSSELEYTLNKVFSHGENNQDKPKPTALHRILLAEDSEINASIIYSHLTDLGHNVDIATDGTTALYAMHKHHYDIVFMDINMPGMTGLEVTTEWRKLEKGNSPLPIIAVTARATSEDKKLCLDVGMNGFLTKPISESTLIETIDEYINELH